MTSSGSYKSTSLKDAEREFDRLRSQAQRMYPLEKKILTECSSFLIWTKFITHSFAAGTVVHIAVTHITVTHIETTWRFPRVRNGRYLCIRSRLSSPSCRRERHEIEKSASCTTGWACCRVSPWNLYALGRVWKYVEQSTRLGSPCWKNDEGRWQRQ